MASQLVLDPSDAPNGYWKPDGPLKSDLREFGKVPNTAEWLPGDLLLFSAIKPSTLQSGITQCQQKMGYLPEDARWQHAAVVVAGTTLCESTSRGAIIANLIRAPGKSRLPVTRLRLRRPLNLTDKQRLDTAANALSDVGLRYNVGAVAKLAIDVLTGRLPVPASRLNSTCRYCSELYCVAYGRATGRVLYPRDGAEMSPAFLSQSDCLEDIQIEWLTIGSAPR